MAGVGDEGAAVGEHADEAGEEAEYAEGIHLAAHADFLIKEPPAAAELHLSGEGAVIEGISHGHHDLVVLGIEAVEDGLCEFVLRGQAVKELVACGCGRKVVDGVVAGIGTHQVEHLGVVVADGAHVELLGPAGLGIHDCHVVEEGAAELVELAFGGTLSKEDHLEDGFDFELGVVIGIESLETVVGELAAHEGEEVVTDLEGLDEVCVGVDFAVCGLSKLLEVFLVGLGILDSHGFVRAPCRNDFGAEGVLQDLLVIAEVVGRVVGGAHGLYVELADEGLAAEFFRRKLRVAFVKDLTCSCRAKKLVDAENAAQLKVCPVVERVTHGVGNGLGPFLEGFPGGLGAAGEVFLGDAVCTHGSPLVVVSVVAIHKPELGDITELDVLCNLLGHQVAVIVDDGHVLCMLMIEFACSLCLQHEVFVDECHNNLL